MNVGVDKAGKHQFPGNVDFGFPLVLSHARNETARYRNVAVTQFVAEHVDIIGVLQDQIGLFASGGHFHDMLFPRHFPVDSPCVTFPVCHA